MGSRWDPQQGPISRLAQLPRWPGLACGAPEQRAWGRCPGSARLSPRGGVQDSAWAECVRLRRCPSMSAGCLWQAV